MSPHGADACVPPGRAARRSCFRPGEETRRASCCLRRTQCRTSQPEVFVSTAVCFERAARGSAS